MRHLALVNLEKSAYRMTTYPLEQHGYVANRLIIQRRTVHEMQNSNNGCHGCRRRYWCVRSECIHSNFSSWESGLGTTECAKQASSGEAVETSQKFEGRRRRRRKWGRRYR